MPKLTDTQLVILSAASQRKDGALFPLPKSLKLNKGALTAVLNSLLKHGLIGERPAARDEEHWREESGQRLALVITGSGLKAVGAEPMERPAPEPAPAITLTRRPGPCGYALSRSTWHQRVMWTNIASGSLIKKVQVDLHKADLVRRDPPLSKGESHD